MYGQLQFDMKGGITDKVEQAIMRLKAFEPPEGYYVAFSGGKDSQCVYHLCQMAGVKFDAHYMVTSVEPPELMRFIRDKYPDVIWERPRDSRGKPVTMWTLIPEHTVPPTRFLRYCCKGLKETGGGNRRVVTGVRWAESAKRKANHGFVDLKSHPKTMVKLANNYKVPYKINQKGGMILLNNDNDINRQMVEHCPLKAKVMINPILDWEEEDVWGFLNGNNIEHCSLYDEGFNRLGCIGCPLAGRKNMERDFKRWPRYKELYIRAFDRMIEKHPESGIGIYNPDSDKRYRFKKNVTGAEIFDTWILDASRITWQGCKYYEKEGEG